MSGAASDDAHAVVEALAGSIRAALGDTVEAIWLHGSWVEGDFDPRSSDLDLTVALREDVDDAGLARLAAMHERLVRDHPAWDDRIDVVYVSTRSLREFRERRSPLVVITPGEPLHRTSGGADWLTSWHRVRAASVALFGPPAGERIGPTTHGEFVRAVRQHVAWMPARIAADPRPAFVAYAVLTACRGLHLAAEDTHVSKAHAARWAAARHPEWAPLIERALTVRTRQHAPDAPAAPPLEDAAAFLAFAAREVQPTP